MILKTMKMNWKLLKLTAAFLFFFTAQHSAQTCGFGCFGLGGFYAGFGMQQFKADGLNDHLKLLRQLSSAAPLGDDIKFDRATGFRLGANLFRTKYKRFLFSAKGYYQFLKQEKDSHAGDPANPQTTTYSLKLNYWGVGVDVGYSVFKFVDWKIIDAAVLFHTAEFSIKNSFAGVQSDEQFNGTKNKLGYSVGTGFVLRLVGDYISIEGTAAYNRFSVDKLSNDRGIDIGKKSASEKKFIEDGGLGAAVQLNIGIPLY